MLIWRLTLGPLIIAGLIGICWLDDHARLPGTYLLPLAMVAGVMAAGEIIRLFRARAASQQPLAWTIYVGVMLTIAAAGAPAWIPLSWPANTAIGPLGWLAIGLTAGLLLTIVGELCRYDSPGQATTNLALAVFAIVYVGGLIGFLVQLRLLGSGTPTNHARLGLLALASLIIIVKLSDIGQYTAGRMFGVRKLSPKVSPGKTWEGALGGLLFALVGGLVTIWLGRQLHAGHGILRFTSSGTIDIADSWRWIIYAIAVAAAGIIGDLAESLLKRDAGVKDSSNWLPGFGGVLDLLDSLLVAAPVAYLFWTFDPVLP